MTPKELRCKIRDGEMREQTGGLCPGYVQVNLAIIPARYAGDFARFCELNPKPCPVLAVSKPGDWTLPALGDDIDVRRDVPAYVSYEDGHYAGEHESLMDQWDKEQFVTFALGCSYSFDHILVSSGLPVRHNELGGISPAYVTNVPNVQAGPFGGELVVSMRPFTPAQAIRAIEITSRYPHVHGAPVHFGDPAAIGIEDIYSPTYVGPVEFRKDELPVFWACGVTPQRAILSAKLPLAFAHKAGHMLVTDLATADYVANRSEAGHD
ncbi:MULTISPECIES: putative hydro-lyase [unclassified Cupriavidus]|uniref:putative hydro-lyase n=1 Tax=unclassified Cupriavidus TaxID=2640874 RepID=UPI001C006F45|nr:MULTISPECIES: putative hydro-lyase [unclassified Cupriavidus]MCA3187688.1 putative hydro-lyase [Cupriavidus sp.]MCA3189122.1 putative hydro-lyase [Cupriavidus sp.]MCA3198842.1 putative hydro-lyase [Cupriavidus sp.]MCA3201586.1 putative hydro-lyase [Cupriavidus sp.]MCA3230877.1 putative hydro-lyase [Cupriavidus sp.]